MDKKQIEQSLERIELQLRAVYWDNLMYYCQILAFFMTTGALILASMGILMMQLITASIVFSILSFVIIQISEYYQMKRIRRFYEN